MTSYVNTYIQDYTVLGADSGIYLSLLNFIWLVIAQCSNLSRSLCKALPNLVSSTNLFSVHLTPVSRSLLKPLKRTGPKIEPWGTPLDEQPQLVLRTPELDAVLQVGSHQSGIEEQNHLPRLAGHASFDAAQDAVGFLGCKHTLTAHVQLFIYQYPQVLLHRAALNPFIPQSLLIWGIALTQVQDLALGLVELHESRMGPLLEIVQQISCTIQLGVICKLAEGALDPAVYVTDEDIK
ncbi:hypothetical protein QYF61_018385 [Mycteria americana]|uniref:Uncharacterized protein n=1 Tax=Mycteria americana TaxID=33587 RepID=A0AAN7MJR6_MYCAM|nr:hypothetical protein QYF61_018385 [Mycteria americana]